MLPIKKFVNSTLNPGVWEIKRIPTAIPIAHMAAMTESSLCRQCKWIQPIIKAERTAATKAPIKGDAHVIPCERCNQRQKPIPLKTEWEILPLINTIRLTTTYEPMMPLTIEAAKPASRADKSKELVMRASKKDISYFKLIKGV